MSWLSTLFKGGRNPAHEAMPYLDRIPGETRQYQEPFFNAGKQAIPQLQGQYDQLLNNPGGMINNIGGQFQQSPGFHFALQQALDAARHGAAAGGMAGSPQHEAQNMEVATGLGNQDYYNWLNQATGMYGKGLSGMQGLAGMGMNAGNNMADMIAQTLAQQGNLAFQGQAQKNRNQSDMFGNIAGLAGAGLGAFSSPYSPGGRR